MKPSRRKEIRNWFVQNVSGNSDYLYIPAGQSNAFVGVVASSENPTIAILDFQQCVINLQHNGMEYDDAFDFVYNKSKYREGHEPLICYRYPSLHPALTK